MKIIEEKEAIILYGKGKKTFNHAEQWLFGKEYEKVRIQTLVSMKENQTAVVAIDDFKEYGSKSKKGYNHHMNLNKVFLLDEIPLKATCRGENILIKKMERLNASILMIMIKTIRFQCSRRINN